MAQPSVASFFNTRKRAATEDATSIKNRRFELDDSNQVQEKDVPPPVQQPDEDEIAKSKVGMRTRSGRAIKRIGVPSITEQQHVSPQKMSKIEHSIKQHNLVQFIQKGPLSPHKKPSNIGDERQKINETTPSTASNPSNLLDQAFNSKNNAANIERGLKTPTKQIIKGSTPIKHGELKSLVRKELNFDEVKSKISRSAKLNELKASLSRIQELEKTRKAQKLRNRRLRDGIASSPTKSPVAVQLKEFKEIELEVLTSPSKTFKTPTKLPPPTPDKNELMSPRHTDKSKRLLFSPAKNGSPSKMVVAPAYQRFMNLAESSKAGQLPLPFKYRHLLELFKAVDSVCAMFHNRKECITFKKLKPAVQRMLRKNFTESHLAQIKHVYPDAFVYTQMKMRNYGSTSKADYFQLVVTPNVENVSEQKQKIDSIPSNKNNDDDNILTAAQSNSMNPNVMTERMKYFQYALLQRVKEEHHKFLNSLDPPLSIAREKVTRWHPDFDLENCTDIECAHLPQPPNIEKYSSARDILSTARNLFNCATPMERAMERYEAKLMLDKGSIMHHDASETLTPECKGLSQSSENAQTVVTAKPTIPPVPGLTANGDATTNLLKGLPKSLVEKIRAKQAAKALEAMTRRPSQDREATNYSRLPELARHLRNVYITERKGVLTLEMVIKKMQNSFRTSLTPQDMEAHLRLISKEIPNWATFHEVRKTIYLKLNKEMEMSKIIEKLEKVANEKSN